MARDPAAATPAPGAAGDGGHPLALRLGLGVTAAVLVIDQATKELVLRVLELGRFVPWLGEHVGWELVYNPGGAFGLPAPAWLFLVVTVLVVVLVVRMLPRTDSLLAAVAYGLLLAGALGNVVDRLLREGGADAGIAGGWVVDFVAWGAFPRFNVADSAITVGFVLLVFAMLREERAHDQRSERDRDEGGDDPDDPQGPLDAPQA